MARTVLSLSALILSIAMLVSGNTFLTTLLGVRLSLEQVGPSVIGWVLVCYSFGFVLGSLYCSRIIERVGHIRSFAVFCALMAMFSLLHPLLIHPVFWAILRAGAGLSMAGLLLVIESWFSTRATNDNRATLFAVYQIVFYLAATGGQLLISIGRPESFMPFSVAGVLLVIALIPLALTRMEAPSIEQVERLSFRALYKISPLGLFASMVSGIVISAFNNIGPVYGHQIELDLNAISIFMATTVFAAMIFAWPLGRVSDLFDRRRVLLVLALLAAIASSMAAAFGQTHVLALFVGAQTFVGISAAIYPIAVAVTNDKLHSHQIVAASAGLLLSYGIGSCIGPVLGSSMISLVGASGLFMGTATSLFILAGYTYWYIQHSKRIPVQAQETFVPSMPFATAIIAEIDPRNEDFVESASIQEEAQEEALQRAHAEQATDIEESVADQGHSGDSPHRNSTEP